MITIIRFFRDLYWQLGDGLDLALGLLGEESATAVLFSSQETNH